ncbi:MAG: L-seryl-tRNA(Sec) selenium transferase, partial [Chloroflexi bacterium]|nr:L-seryl-tRNA(Sec) selenium transferase [Chloroflexota bacterium]
MNAPDPSASESPYRDLPSVDRLLADARVAALVPDHGHEAVAGLALAVLADYRRTIAAAGAPPVEPVADALLARAAATFRPSLVRVGNA